jgi:hypothetical protein
MFRGMRTPASPPEKKHWKHVSPRLQQTSAILTCLALLHVPLYLVLHVTHLLLEGSHMIQH